MQSCDEVYLANGASASDQGHYGEAAVALHALVLLPSIHHLAHNLNTCTTRTTLSFCGFFSQIYHVLDSFLRRVIFASWTPPPIPDKGLLPISQKPIAPLYTTSPDLLQTIAARPSVAVLLLTTGTGPCPHGCVVHSGGTAADAYNRYRGHSPQGSHVHCMFITAVVQ